MGQRQADAGNLAGLFVAPKLPLFSLMAALRAPSLGTRMGMGRILRTLPPLVRDRRRPPAA